MFTKNSKIKIGWQREGVYKGLTRVIDRDCLVIDANFVNEQIQGESNVSYKVISFSLSLY